MDGRRIAGLLGCALALLVAAPARAAVIDDDPAIAAAGAGDMRMFVRGTDGKLWTRSWNGTVWSPWSSLGGVLTSGPAAMVRPGGIYDVFVRSSDNRYYHRAFTPSGGWSPWGVLSDGRFNSAPGATYRQGSGEIDVVGVGTDTQLYHSYWTPASGWSAWGALGGFLSGKPSVVSPGPGVLDIYLRGVDNRLYQKYWLSSSGWSDFIPQGGGLTSGVAATTWAGDRRDIFVRGGGRTIYYKSFAGSWVGWTGLGAAATSGPGATSSGPGRLEVVVRSGQMIYMRSYATKWSRWNSLGRAPLYRAPAAPPTPVPGSAPPRPELRLRAGFGCIPVGGRVPVRVRVYQRSGRLKPRIIKVIFFMDRGKRRRVDRHPPYKTRMRVTYKRGSKHRVHARIYFRRQGQKRVQRKTVSKRFTMCR